MTPMIELRSELLALELEPSLADSASRAPRRAGGRQGYFLKGPIPWRWLAQATRCGGSAGSVALVIRLLAGMSRSPAIALSLSCWALRDLGVSRWAAGRGLDALATAGLIRADRRSGRKARVEIVELDDEGGTDVE